MKRSGRCGNFGACPKADNNEVIEVADGENFLCPSCGTGLKEVTGGERKKPKRLRMIPIIIGGILLLLLAGASAYFLQSRSSPVLPTDLQATAETSKRVSLTWAETPSHYKTKIERSATSGSGFTEILEAGEGLSTITDDTTAPNTTYYYRIRFNSGSNNSAYSSEVAATTPAAVAVEPQPSATQTPPTQPIAPASPRPTETPPLVATNSILFRVHGSNTIGAELAPAWAEAFLRKKGARDITKSIPEKDHTMIQAMLPGESSPKSIEIVALGSGTAFKDLAAAACDIGMASRQIKPDEAKLLQEKGLGDMLSRACENVVGLDGIAVIVNPRNTIDQLTIDEMQQIFSGTVTDWSQVGGTPGPIVVFLREEASGTRDMFKAIVLKGGNFSTAATIPGTGSNDDVTEAVSRTIGGVGFVGLPYVRDNKALKVSDGKATAFLPTVFTVKKEAYPLSRRLFLYAPANLTNEWAIQYLQFALSWEGQKIVDEMKFVGLNPDLAQKNVQSGPVPAGYAALTSGAVNLGIDIRFLLGSSTLDNRSYRDMLRILELMQQPDNRDSQLILIGFADSSGTPKQNRILSEKRAKTVQQTLNDEGIEVAKAAGFGDAVPVASNDTPEGREKNRRVEVWLRR